MGIILWQLYNIFLPEAIFLYKSQRIGTQEDVSLKLYQKKKGFRDMEKRFSVTIGSCTQFVCGFKEEGFNTVSENCSWLIKCILTEVQHKKVNHSSLLVLSLILPPWVIGEIVFSLNTDVALGSPQCIQIGVCLTQTQAHPHINTSTQQQQQQVRAGSGLKTVRHNSEIVWKMKLQGVVSVTEGRLLS